jgi:hypothetical protein
VGTQTAGFTKKDYPQGIGTATVTITKAGVNSTITHTPTVLWPIGANTATVIFANAGSPQVFVTNTWTYTIAPYTTLSPSLKVAADTSKPGFKWNIFANAATQRANALRPSSLCGERPWS